MRIEDLLMSLDRPPIEAGSFDILRDQDSLEEAQLVGVRFDAIDRILGILVDLRTSLQIRDAEAALIVVRDVDRIAWENAPVFETRTSWTIMRSTSRAGRGSVQVQLQFLPDGRLNAVGLAAECIVGRIPQLPETPPDYNVDSDDLIRLRTPAWGSEMEPLRAYRLGAE
jgi:hypothetical protein